MGCRNSAKSGRPAGRWSAAATGRRKLVLVLEQPLPLPPRLLRPLLTFLEVPVLSEPEDGGGALADDAADRRAVAGASLFPSGSSSRMRSSRASTKVGKGRARRRSVPTWLNRSLRPRMTYMTNVQSVIASRGSRDRRPSSSTCGSSP
jgi:hypothetical protein